MKHKVFAMRDDGGRETAAQTVYKIVAKAEWALACDSGSFSGSSDDVRDGFVHLSTADQLPGTLARHFRGRRDLVLVALRAAALGDALRWEPSRNDRLFPHLYAALPTALALWVKPLSLGADGAPILDPEGLGC
ncbi:MAG: DUF952 domain-containing protein [Hyphomicrobium sp.]